MIRSTMLLGAVLAGLAAPAAAQNRRADEAQAAAAQAEQAAADALRAAQIGDAPADVEPIDIEPAHIEPLDITPPASQPAESEPQAPIEWIAQPVVQPLAGPALVPPVELAEPEVPEPAESALAFEETPSEATQAEDIAEGGEEPNTAFAYVPPLEDAAPPAPRSARHTTRRVQLAYSPQQRDAWLVQCGAIYRGSYDCAGYLAHYEQQSLAGATRDPAFPARPIPAPMPIEGPEF